MADQALSIRLTDKSRVKAKIGDNGTSNDSVIDALVNGVSQFIEGQCNRRFKQTVYTQQLLSIDNPTYKIYLDQIPVTALSAFEYASGLPNNKTWTAVPASDYELELDRFLNTTQVSFCGMIHCYFQLNQGVNNYRVTYTAGFLIDFDNEGDPSQHNLPQDISELADELVIKAWRRRNDHGKDSSSFNGANIKWMTMLEETHKQIINRYKRIKF
jgi:hypothetical protein